MRSALLGAVFTFVFGAVTAGIFLHLRVQALASVDFRISYPSVPVEVTEAIKAAEARYYSQEGISRRLCEEAEDMLALVWPGGVTALNLSVGPYRIKADTIQSLLPWAIEEGFLTLIDAEPERALSAIAYFSEQPALADWGATVVLENLRWRHPNLRKMSWDRISSDPQLVAKLYSGYMGAGGDWATWESTLMPGLEAVRRMDLN